MSVLCCVGRCRLSSSRWSLLSRCQCRIGHCRCRICHVVVMSWSCRLLWCCFRVVAVLLSGCSFLIGRRRQVGCFCRTVAVSSSLPSSRLAMSWSYRRSLSLSGRPVVVTAVVVSLSFRSLCALLFLLRCCRSANSVCVTLCWYQRPAL